MKNSTLLALAIGAIAGAYLVDTFQPAQDLVDGCKKRFRSKIKLVPKHAKKAQLKDE